jgi:hypothetical protein
VWRRLTARDRLLQVILVEARTVKLALLNPEMFNGDVMFGYRNAQKEAVDFRRRRRYQVGS